MLNPRGQHIIGLPEMNPFVGMNVPEPADMGPAYGPSSTPTPTAATAGAAPTSKAGPVRNYVQAWKDFFQKVKTDPNTRLAVMQAVNAASQPAATGPEGIGRALQVGMSTLQGLEGQQYERAKEARAESRAERGVAVQEGQLEEARKRGTREGEQFTASMQQQRDELAVRRQEVESSDAYRQAQIKLGYDEIKAGKFDRRTGESGQVNQRIDDLAANLITLDAPELRQYTDPEKKKAAAKVMAFDLVNKPGQTREKFVADFLGSQRLFMKNTPEKGEAYTQELLQLVQQANSFADFAGLTEAKAMPGSGGQPAPAPTPSPSSAPAPTAAPAQQPATPTGPPQIGEIRMGYRFKGGDQYSPSSWEKVQ